MASKKKRVARGPWVKCAVPWCPNEFQKMTKWQECCSIACKNVNYILKTADDLRARYMPNAPLSS